MTALASRGRAYPVGLGATAAGVLGPFADTMTGENWSTTTSGTGAQSWTAGTAVFSCTNAGVGLARIADADYQRATSWEFLVRARTDTTSGTANEQVYLLGGGSITRYVGLASQENDVLVAFWGDPYASLATATGPTLVQRQAGNVWYRITSAPGVVTWWWGLGSGSTRPTRWTPFHTSSNVNVLAAASGSFAAFAAQTDAARTYQVTALGIQTGYLGSV